MTEQYKDKMLRLWREEKSVEEILKELGWNSKSSRTLLRTLRELGESVPFGLSGKDMYDLTINTVHDAYCIENIVFKGLGELDIQGMLLQQKIYFRSEQNAGEFGTLSAYESRFIKVTKLQQGDNVLIAIDGKRAEVNELAGKITKFYQEKGFEKS